MGKKFNIKKLVQEEIGRMIQESKDKTPTIEKGLEDLRKKFFGDILKRDLSTDHLPAMEKRVLLHTVAELLEVSDSDLMLYFLNHVKNKNEHSLVEYHMGQIYFYSN